MTRHPIPGETWTARATQAIAEIVEVRAAEGSVVYRRSEPGFPHVGLPWCTPLALFLDAFAPPEEHRDVKPDNVLQAAGAKSPAPASRMVLYVAHPLGAPDRAGLDANLRRAMRWLSWLRRSFPEVTFIAPWIAAVLSGEDDTDPTQREAGLVDADAVVARCDGVVLCGGRVSSGMARERKAAFRAYNLIWLGDEPPVWRPPDGAEFGMWADLRGMLSGGLRAAGAVPDAEQVPGPAPVTGAESFRRFEAVDLATSAGLAYSPDPRGLDDDGARVIPPRLCCARIGGGWCYLDSGHAPPCVVPPPRALPVSDFGPRRARR